MGLDPEEDVGGWIGLRVAAFVVVLRVVVLRVVVLGVVVLRVVVLGVVVLRVVALGVVRILGGMIDCTVGLRIESENMPTINKIKLVNYGY